MIARRWFTAHQERLTAAVEANRSRVAHAAFQESPSRKHHPEGAKQRGLAAYEARLGECFTLVSPGSTGWVGAETNPWTREALGVTYPTLNPDVVLPQMLADREPFVEAGPEARVGVCLEILARLEARLFEATFMTHATTGQGFMMAFAGSGANSLDRGLEALAMAWDVQRSIPGRATFERSFGHGTVTLDKRYHLRPLGVAVVLSCGTYPAWNAYPALFANLATGNPVVLKPHPNTLLPMALAVQVCQEVLEEAGFAPHLVVLAPDERSAPIAKELLLRPEVRLIDFTGGQAFGGWIEQNCRHAQVYTETSGCNSVVLESLVDTDGVFDALALGLTLFSGQMCTAPQNVYVPADGVGTPEGRLTYEEVVERLVTGVRAKVADPAHAAGLCGALFDDGVLAVIDGARSGDVLLEAESFTPPGLAAARTSTPLIVQVDAEDRGIAQREHFGPVAFVIRARDAAHALNCATEDAARFGAIASYAYTADPDFADRVERAFVRAGASVGLNLVRQKPMHFAGAYSDFHVTGLNPAGTATLCDPRFVADRFRVVQCKRER